MSPPPRPTFRDPKVISDAVEGILPDILQWDGGTEADKPDLRIALLDALEDEGDDTYRIARHLEQFKYWQADEDLIQALGGLRAVWNGAHRDAVAAWVARNKIQPDFQVGTRVRVPHDGGTVVGEVYRVDSEQAEYHVYVESLGHVRKGVGTHGLIVRFEDARAK